MSQAEECSLAESYGARCLPDVARGVGWCKFELGDWLIWFCSRGWACAQLKGNMYVGHLYAKSLAEALAGVSALMIARSLLKE